MYDTAAGTLSTGYVAEVGETPQTAGDVSTWFSVARGQTLALTLTGTFGATTVIQLKSTKSPVNPSVKLVASLTAEATTKYIAADDTWYQVYFYVQDGAETIDYSMTIDTPDFGITIVNDTVNGKAYQLTTESGLVTPVEV